MVPLGETFTIDRRRRLETLRTWLEEDAADLVARAEDATIVDDSDSDFGWW